MLHNLHKRFHGLSCFISSVSKVHQFFPYEIEKCSLDYWGGIDGAVRGMSTLPSFLDAMLLKVSSGTLLV